MAQTSTRGRRERKKTRAKSQGKLRPPGNLKKAPPGKGPPPVAAADVLEHISVRVRVRDWVLDYLNKRREDVTEKTHLKDLKLTGDGEIGAFTGAFNGFFKDALGLRNDIVTEEEVTAEFGRKDETVAGLILFLSHYVDAAKAASSAAAVKGPRSS